jgi:hypothetical protein
VKVDQLKAETCLAADGAPVPTFGVGDNARFGEVGANSSLNAAEALTLARLF